MNPKNFLTAFAGTIMIAAAGTTLSPSAAHANWWAGGERAGSCYIPNRQTNFNCQFGSYQVVNGARQIGGFYINPRHQSGKSGTILIQYRVNGGGWIDQNLTLNTTSGNYIDFGNGVKSFDYRFNRPSSDSLGAGSNIYFNFNYDLDR